MIPKYAYVVKVSRRLGPSPDAKRVQEAKSFESAVRGERLLRRLQAPAHDILSAALLHPGRVDPRGY
jgi:hypothetical protein